MVWDPQTPGFGADPAAPIWNFWGRKGAESRLGGLLSQILVGILSQIHREGIPGMDLGSLTLLGSILASFPIFGVDCPGEEQGPPWGCAVGMLSGILIPNP